MADEKMQIDRMARCLLMVSSLAEAIRGLPLQELEASLREKVKAAAHDRNPEAELEDALHLAGAARSFQLAVINVDFKRQRRSETAKPV